MAYSARPGGRAAQRDPDHGDDDEKDDERARDEVESRATLDDAGQPFRGTAAGVRRTTSAAPAHTNDIASVTTMSGTRVMTTSTPLMMPRIETQHEHADDHRDRERLGLVLHETAAVTLVSAIIEPIDRSMPPEMTTIAWATAAIASGSAPIGEALELGRPVGRLDQIRDEQDHDEQPEQPQRPRVALRPVAQLRHHAQGVPAPRHRRSALMPTPAVRDRSDRCRRAHPRRVPADLRRRALRRPIPRPRPPRASATSAGRSYAARNRVGSSASSTGISATIRPPKMTIARSQASWISLSSEV